MVVPFIANAQDHIPNGGFEDYEALPCALNDLRIQELLAGWFAPILTTTDYYNSIVDEACYLNPGKWGVTARTGNGMIGIITAEISKTAGVVSRFQYREYAGIKLSTPLEPQKLYAAEMFAMNRKVDQPLTKTLKADHLSMAFSDSLVFNRTGEFYESVSLKAQIISNERIGTQWTPVKGCFIPDTPLDYLYIGNFTDIDSVDIDLSPLDFNDHGLAYYYIDDVSVTELSYDLSQLKARVTGCDENGRFELNAFVPGATGYVWDDGSTGPKRKVTGSPAAASRFVVDIRFQECIYKHTFYLDSIPQLYLGRDSTLCEGEVLPLKNRLPGRKVTWWDGTQDSVKFINAPGTYLAKTESAGCAVEDQIQVDFMDCPGFVPNVITPNGDAFNDYLIFENIENREWSLRIFNRWGQQVYTSGNYNNDWNGDGMTPGLYYYVLSSSHRDKEVKGWVQLVR